MTATPLPPPARPARPARPAFRRSFDDRLVAGVCGGLGQRLGVDPVVLRLALVPLSLAGGAGIVAYVVLWALAGEPAAGPADVAPRRTATSQQLVAIALVTLGALVFLRTIGLWFGDGVVWPIALAALGSAFLWARDDQAPVFGLRRSVTAGRSTPDPDTRGLDASLGAGLAQAGPLRVIGGAVLIVTGMIGFLAANDRLSALLDVGFAVAVGLAGIFLVFGPWLTGLVGQLGEERRERIHGEERAAVAAHLHDSVLQTLALIQRAADHPARTRALARRQERELRAWLYGQTGAGPGDRPGTFGEAMAQLATDIEEDHDVRVEAVVVGDTPIGADGVVLVAAIREAVANSARHAQVDVVDVYVEVDDDEVVATIRDRGVGFEPAEVADDRHGIRHSIRGRLERVGGRATLTSTPGAGTEWELRVPHRPTTNGTSHG